MPIPNPSPIADPAKPAEPEQTYPDLWLERIEIVYVKGPDGETLGNQAIIHARAHNAVDQKWRYTSKEHEDVQVISIPELEAAIADTNYPAIAQAMGGLLSGIASAIQRKADLEA